MGTYYKGTKKKTRALDTYIKLIRATESLISRIKHVKWEDNLTLSQFGVLEVLYHLGPLCQSELSKKLLKSAGNTVMVIDNLQKRDLVERKRSEEDRRYITVHLTKKGEQLIGNIFPQHVDAITEQMSILTESEQEELGRLCKILGKQEQ